MKRALAALLSASLACPGRYVCSGDAALGQRPGKTSMPTRPSVVVPGLPDPAASARREQKIAWGIGMEHFKNAFLATGETPLGRPGLPCRR